jgi:hypothetical protein
LIGAETDINGIVAMHRNVAAGSKADLTAPKSDFPFTPESGLKSDIPPYPFGADIVAKVENRTTPKISRKRIFRRRSRCNAL